MSSKSITQTKKKSSELAPTKKKITTEMNNISKSNVTTKPNAKTKTNVTTKPNAKTKTNITTKTNAITKSNVTTKPNIVTKQSTVSKSSSASNKTSKTGSKTKKIIKPSKNIVKSPSKKNIDSVPDEDVELIESDNDSDNSCNIVDLPPKSPKRNSSTNTKAVPYEKKFCEIQEALRNNHAEQKRIMNEFKELLTVHKKELKNSNKINRSNTGKHSGFNKPEPIPQGLADLLEISDDEMSRSQVTKLLYEYFKSNNMYNKNSKRKIEPNDELIELFGLEDGDEVDFYNLQKWIKKVYDNQ